MKGFTFAGVSSLEHGLLISGEGVYNVPERDVEKVGVPGRNGDLVLDNERYQNITVSYRAGLLPGRQAMSTRAFHLAAWLSRRPGYERLEDDYDHYTFRLARYQGPMEFDVHALHRSGEVVLRFDCKPQKFYKSGEAETSCFDGNDINNPYLYPALPLIRVCGNGEPGTVTVRGVTVEILDTSEPIILDCERQDAYIVTDGGYTDANGRIRAARFPRLESGANPVALTGGVEYLVVTPRWWSL